MSVTINVGRPLKALREAKRLTLEDLARRLGKGEATVRGYEWSKANPRWSTLRKHLDAMGCTVHDLADEAEPLLISAGRRRRRLGEVVEVLENLQRELNPDLPEPERGHSPPSSWPVTRYIGPILANLRAGQGLTTAQLAERLERKEMTVRAFEVTSANPRWTTVASYLDGLGCTLHDLADEAEPILAINPARQLRDVTAAADLLKSLLRAMEPRAKDS